MVIFLTVLFYGGGLHSILLPHAQVLYIYKSRTHTRDNLSNLQNTITFSSLRNKFSGGNTLYRRKKVSENLNQSLIISIPMKRKLFREETVPTQIGIFDGAYQRLM